MIEDSINAEKMVIVGQKAISILGLTLTWSSARKI
jgi:hypothetical protein